MSGFEAAKSCFTLRLRTVAVDAVRFVRTLFKDMSDAVGTTLCPCKDQNAIEILFVEQVEKQLYKLIDVIDVANLTSAEAVMRELALIKVRCTAAGLRPTRPMRHRFGPMPSSSR